MDAYRSLVHLLNPEFRYMGDGDTLFPLDAPRDIHTLAIHNIKLSRERQEISS